MKIWKNTARHFQNWLIFCLNNHTCQRGGGKHICIACHSVNTNPQTQRPPSSCDGEKCFPLFLIRGCQEINETPERCSWSTASQRATLSHLSKGERHSFQHLHNEYYSLPLPADTELQVSWKATGTGNEPCKTPVMYLKVLHCEGKEMHCTTFTLARNPLGKMQSSGEKKAMKSPFILIEWVQKPADSLVTAASLQEQHVHLIVNHQRLKRRMQKNSPAFLPCWQNCFFLICKYFFKAVQANGESQKKL